MNKSVLALVVGSVLALSGCDNSPVGVSGGSETGSSSSSSQGVDTSKELKQSRTVALMEGRSLAPLITETASDLYGTSPGKALNFNLIEWLYILERGTEQDQKKLLTMFDTVDRDGILDNAPEIQQRWFKAIELAARKPTQFRGEVIASAFFALAAHPVMGWSMDALRSHNEYEEAKAFYYTVLAVNAGMEAIAKQVSYASFQNREKAKKSIREAMNSKVVKNAILDAFAPIYTEQPIISIDGTGSPSGLGFRANSDKVEANQYGLTIVRNGSQYYGQGYISGEEYIVLISKLKGATMTKSSTSSIGSESTQSTTGGANVKAGQ